MFYGSKNDQKNNLVVIMKKYCWEDKIDKKGPLSYCETIWSNLVVVLG